MALAGWDGGERSSNALHLPLVFCSPRSPAKSPRFQQVELRALIISELHAAACMKPSRVLLGAKSPIRSEGLSFDSGAHELVIVYA